MLVLIDRLARRATRLGLGCRVAVQVNRPTLAFSRSSSSFLSSPPSWSISPLTLRRWFDDKPRVALIDRGRG